jgi:uncharacterized membrane protein
MATAATSPPDPGRRAQVVHGIDLRDVEQAVKRAEQSTTGEIRVALARFYFWGDVRRAAARAFDRLGMRRTRDHNGVLIFVAPWRRRFAILGDAGIDGRVAAGFWDGLAGPLGQAFRAGDPTGGLARAIAEIGAQLAAHFPAAAQPGGGPADNPNELPDTVVLDLPRRR